MACDIAGAGAAAVEPAEGALVGAAPPAAIVPVHTELKGQQPTLPAPSTAHTALSPQEIFELPIPEQVADESRLNAPRNSLMFVIPSKRVGGLSWGGRNGEYWTADVGGSERRVLKTMAAKLCMIAVEE